MPSATNESFSTQPEQGPTTHIDMQADAQTWLTEFVPRPFLSNGHLQTIMGNYLPRTSTLPAPQASLVEVAPATAHRAASHVLCHCHWQPEHVRRQRLTVILLHGLEGSSNSQYVIGNANKLWRAHCNVIRMNMRNCGVYDGETRGDDAAGAVVRGGKARGMEQFSPTLYHSGLSGDVLAVCQHFIRTNGIESLALVGYSMGGNLVLKLAGEVTRQTLPQLKAVVGVSPAVDLGPSAEALHRLRNRLYERKFLGDLQNRFRRKVELFPEIYSTARLQGVRSLREFDDRITAFYEGFASADDYYHRAAAARVVDNIAIPTLVLHAVDDPFVRILPETCERMRSNPHITYVETRHGGHCAFLAQPRAAVNDDGYWAETTLLGFLLATTQQLPHPDNGSVPHV